MRRPLAWMLSGGGSRRALQVGAVRALLETDIHPDMLLGTSIGAVNAALLATRGVTLQTCDALVKAWNRAATADLLPSRSLWLTMRVLLNSVGFHAYGRLREFYVAPGLSPDLRFRDIEGVRLRTIAADLNAGCAIVYGRDPDESVLDGVLASTALPPWVAPLEVGSQSLIDGGVVTSLPIEPAVADGARTIIALDLLDQRDVPLGRQGIRPLVSKVMHAVEQRQRDMEMALAAAHDVTVHPIVLRGAEPVPIWDFRHTDALITRGYEIARDEIAKGSQQPNSGWRAVLTNLAGFIAGR